MISWHRIPPISRGVATVSNCRSLTPTDDEFTQSVPRPRDTNLSFVLALTLGRGTSSRRLADGRYFEVWSLSPPPAISSSRRSSERKGARGPGLPIQIPSCVPENRLSLPIGSPHNDRRETVRNCRAFHSGCVPSSSSITFSGRLERSIHRNGRVSLQLREYSICADRRRQTFNARSAK